MKHFSNLSSILPLSYSFQSYVLQPCLGGFQILLFHPLLDPSVHSSLCFSCLHFDRMEKCQIGWQPEQGPRKHVKDPPEARSSLLLHASFQDYSEHRFVLIVVPLSILLFPGDTDKETIFQVFWFLCNSLIVIALNFVVNLRLSGQFPKIEAIYDFLKLDEVHVVNNNVLFNAIVSTVILTGNVATSLYFLYIKDSWNMSS